MDVEPPGPQEPLAHSAGTASPVLVPASKKRRIHIPSLSELDQEHHHASATQHDARSYGDGARVNRIDLTVEAEEAEAEAEADPTAAAASATARMALCSDHLLRPTWSGLGLGLGLGLGSGLGLGVRVGVGARARAMVRVRVR